MFDYICSGIGLIIIIACVIFAYRKRHNTKEWISVVFFGVLSSVFFMALPTEWKDSGDALLKPLFEIISSFFYSLEVLGGKQDIGQIEAIGFEGILKYIYILINYAAFIATPVLGSSLILSFVGDSLAKIRYALPTSKKTFVFSELNESSLNIAKGLKKSNKKIRIVFCGTKNSSERLSEKARELHAIMLYKACEEIYINSESYEFYLVSEADEKNTQTAKKLISKLGSCDKKICLNAFIKSGPDIALLESIASALVCKNEESRTETENAEWKEPNFSIRFIDVKELFCHNLIYKYPIFNTIGDVKDISVMILGCGETGQSMLRTVAWYGQIYGYRLEIKVYDKKAKEIEKLFDKQCPELNKKYGYNIEFVDVDISTAEFERIITEENEQAKKATVAYVFTGQDELNLAVADSLFGIFRRYREFKETPPIFTRIKTGTKYDSFANEEKGFLNVRNIQLVGNIEEMFAENVLFGSKIEKLALAAHYCYNGAFKEDNDTFNYKKAKNEFLSGNYNRCSSMATALHIDAKLHMFKLLSEKHGKNYSENELKEEFIRITKDHTHPITVELAKCEHERWNAYMRSIGYRSCDIATMKKFASSVESNKDDLSKLHPCIAHWDELDEIQDTYNSMAFMKNKKAKDFKKYDFSIVEKTYEIKIFADNLIEE